MIFYFFILNLFYICAYQILEKEISLYPIQGEYYEYNLYQLAYQNAYVQYQKGQQNQDLQYANNIKYINYQLRWIMKPNIENVQIMDQFQEINLKEGNLFKSLSSNNSHFVALQLNNEIKIYQWKNQVIEQIGSSLNINTSFNCFNVHLLMNFDILIDCYYNNEFYLMNIKDQQQNIVYQSQSCMPIRTKLQSIVNNNKNYIIYGQYYQNYSILSVFSSEYLNLTYWNNNFIDFDIPIKINPYIYILTQQQILQFSISQDYNFELQYNFSQDNMTNFTIINVYYNYWTYSQCDQILIQYSSQSREDFQITSLWGCENQIMLQNIHSQYQFNEQIQTILQNNQYIIFQQNHKIFLYQQGKSAVFKYNNKIQANSLLYFNADNELFAFNLDIIAYKIQIPSLQINLTNLQVTENNQNFSIMSINQEMSQNQILLQIKLIILPKNDTNIYVMFNQDFPQYQYTIMPNIDKNFYSYLKNISNNFFSYSGQLLNYQQNKDSNYFYFTQATYNQIGRNIDQNFSLVQLLQINQNFKETQLLFIGYNNQYLYIFNCYYYHQNYSLTNSILNQTQISINANSLQAAYSIYPEIIVIGLSDNQTIYLIQYQYNDNYIESQTDSTFDSEILDFIVTYNNIIILFKNQEIQIMTLDFQNIFNLNQEQINKFFKNKTIQFNPIQMIMNTQLQSSFLYINNVQDVIIFSIEQNSKPIPIQLIQVNFTIKQINLVNQQLILSYICNNNLSICFQVWNVENLPRYYYEKSLLEINNDDNIIIQSDNLFLYVTLTNKTVYIYNPSLPQHMSLYYQLKLNTTIQSTLAIQNQKSFLFHYSIIFDQLNYFYQLAQIQSINISPNFKILNYNFTYPQVIYNFSVISVLNNSALQQTPNQSITFLSDFMIFQQNRNITINLTSENQDNRNYHFSYPLNLIVDRQYTLCKVNDFSHLKITDLLNINKLFTQGCLQTIYNYTVDKSINQRNFIQNSLITSINNQFFAIIQDNITILNGSLTDLSSNPINFSNCSVSTSYNYRLYTICQNTTTSQYLINFTLNSSGQIVNQTSKKLPVLFQNISKMRSILDEIFILGNLNNQSQFLYWFNQDNNSFIQLTQEFRNKSDNLFECQDFSAAYFQQINGQNQIIIFQTIMNQVFYQIMEIKGENVKIQPLIYLIIHYCNFQYSCFELEKFKYVLIIKLIERNVIILLTDTNNFSYLIRVIIKPQNIQYSNNAATVIRSIPNNDFNSTGNSIYFDGILIQQFQITDQSYFMGIYYLESPVNQSIYEPILMQGSFILTSSQYAMIVNEQYHNGIALYINGIKAFYQILSTQNITCNLKRQTHQLIVNINCSNQINRGNYTITFNLMQYPSKDIGWIIALLTIIFLLLFYFYYKVRQQTKGKIYLEIEL